MQRHEYILTCRVEPVPSGSRCLRATPATTAGAYEHVHVGVRGGSLAVPHGRSFGGVRTGPWAHLCANRVLCSAMVGCPCGGAAHDGAGAASERGKRPLSDRLCCEHGTWFSEEVAAVIGDGCRERSGASPSPAAAAAAAAAPSPWTPVTPSTRRTATLMAAASASRSSLQMTPFYDPDSMRGAGRQCVRDVGASLLAAFGAGLSRVLRGRSRLPPPAFSAAASIMVELAETRSVTGGFTWVLLVAAVGQVRLYNFRAGSRDYEEVHTESMLRFRSPEQVTEFPQAKGTPLLHPLTHLHVCRCNADDVFALVTHSDEGALVASKTPFLPPRGLEATAVANRWGQRRFSGPMSASVVRGEAHLFSGRPTSAPGSPTKRTFLDQRGSDARRIQPAGRDDGTVSLVDALPQGADDDAASAATDTEEDMEEESSDDDGGPQAEPQGGDKGAPADAAAATGDSASPREKPQVHHDVVRRERRSHSHLAPPVTVCDASATPQPRLAAAGGAVAVTLAECIAWGLADVRACSCVDARTVTKQLLGRLPRVGDMPPLAYAVLAVPRRGKTQRTMASSQLMRSGMSHIPVAVTVLESRNKVNIVLHTIPSGSVHCTAGPDFVLLSVTRVQDAVNASHGADDDVQPLGVGELHQSFERTVLLPAAVVPSSQRVSKKGKSGLVTITFRKAKGSATSQRMEEVYMQRSRALAKYQRAKDASIRLAGR